MKEINIYDFNRNPFEDFGKNWMALTAGTKEHGFNTMTIAWGHIGSLWERDIHSNRLPTIICYVRPTRYTKQFLDREDYFTVTAFDESYRNTLGFIGSHSGRDIDKIASTRLTTVFENNTTYFAEGNLVYICKKLYHAPLIENGFIDKGLVDFNYPEKDFHEMYVGEIIKVLSKD